MNKEDKKLVSDIVDEAMNGISEQYEQFVENEDEEEDDEDSQLNTMRRDMKTRGEELKKKLYEIFPKIHIFSSSP